MKYTYTLKNTHYIIKSYTTFVTLLTMSKHNFEIIIRIVNNAQ